MRPAGAHPSQPGVGMVAPNGVLEGMLGVLCHMGGRLLPGSLICPRRTLPITTPIFRASLGLPAAAPALQASTRHDAGPERSRDPRPPGHGPGGQEAAGESTKRGNAPADRRSGRRGLGIVVGGVSPSVQRPRSPTGARIAFVSPPEA